MTPLGWGLAAVGWGYALAWFLLNDRVKLLAYKILDRVKAESNPEAKAEPKPEPKATEPTPEAKTEAKPETKAEPKSEAKGKPKAEPKPEAKVESRPEVKTPSNLTPQIAKRAYELYEERAGKDGSSVRSEERRVAAE